MPQVGDISTVITDQCLIWTPKIILNMMYCFTAFSKVLVDQPNCNIYTQQSIFTRFHQGMAGKSSKHWCPEVDKMLKVAMPLSHHFESKFLRCFIDILVVKLFNSI